MSKKNKLDFHFILNFIILFIVIQLIGIVVIMHYLPYNLQVTFVSSNSDSLLNAIAIVVYILFVTTIILIINKYFKKNRYLYLFEFFMLFFGLSFFLGIFVHMFIAYFITFLLLYLKYFILKEKTPFFINNFLLAIAVGVGGSLIGLGLGLLPVMLLIFLLAIYDIVAVFYTKHMITLANIFLKKKISIMFILKSKQREYKLGGGDFVIPLVVSASLFSFLIKSYSIYITFIPILLVWFFSITGLLLTLYILNKNKYKFLPALPIQVLLMLIVLILVYIIM